MGLFGTSDPVKKEEKMLAKDAKHDDKLVKQALKDLAHTEKEEHRAQKAHDKALKDHAKVVEKEHKLSERVNAAVHQHDEAVSKENKLQHDIQAREQYHAKLEQEIAAKKKAVEQATQRHDLNNHQREDRHHVLEATHGAPGTTATSSTVHPNGINGQPYTTTAAGTGTGVSNAGVLPGHATTGTVPAGERY
ncbi:hypothetical protein QFC24_002021 [Naganishia onofrii]|uniref:Uncharacterized protein n=1 Tax=Naganishia onofrii TaxID=1851511 RepID=A0ACC2XS35_9TREE|nr:hypothetical protein QFC24_002021 [Naganishia onofrii]